MLLVVVSLALLCSNLWCCLVYSVQIDSPISLNVVSYESLKWYRSISLQRSKRVRVKIVRRLGYFTHQ